MELYLIILGPALISLIIYDYFNKFKMNIKECLYYFFSMVFILNSILAVISYLAFEVKDNIAQSIINHPMFSIKYAFIATLIGGVISILIHIINKNVKLEIEVKKKK